MLRIQEYKKRMKLLLKEKGGTCVICKSKNNLNFDHIYPKQKLFTIASHWSYSIESIRQELKKCQILCNKCHIKKHQALHGTISRYRHHNCRCIPCKKIWNSKTIEWKNKKNN